MPANADFLDKVLVVGIFTTSKAGETRDFHVGNIDRFVNEGTEDEGVVLLCHDAVERAFPWDIEAVSSLEPGDYRFGDGMVRDPDYMIQFTVADDD